MPKTSITTKTAETKSTATGNKEIEKLNEELAKRDAKSNGKSKWR